MKISNTFFRSLLSVDLIILIVASIPVGLWVLAPHTAINAMGAGDALTAVGQVFGLFGISLFAINLVLSARLHWVEYLFRGLNRMYIQHSRYGQIAFIALLFHPLLLAVQYSGGTFYGVIQFLLPNSSVAMDFGIIGLGSMLFLIVLTLYLRPKYNIWKWTHKFFGFAFFLGALHVFLIPSTTQLFMPLRVYVLGLCAVGLIAFIYRTLLGRFFVKTYPYTVSNVEQLNDFVTRIQMKPVAQRVVYAAGQFVFVSFSDARVGKESHPFSLVSSPDQDTLELAVKNLGDYTERIPQLAVGSVVSIEGPYGTFFSGRAESATHVWIAGGIGITPFIGKARSLTPGEGPAVVLLYCVKNDEEAVYLDELRAIQESSGGTFRVQLFCYDAEGFITGAYIAKASGGINDIDFYLCAPPVMINALKQQLVKEGASPRVIHSEEFNF